MDFAEEIREFLIESNENLALLDSEIVELEKNPTDERLISSVFRTIHTIKGTSGFFGFKILGSVAHIAENLLGQVREKQRPLTPDLVSLVLETMDAVRALLSHVESSGIEGEDLYLDLKTRLDDAYRYRIDSNANNTGVSVQTTIQAIICENKTAEVHKVSTAGPEIEVKRTEAFEEIKPSEVESGSDELIASLPERELAVRPSDRREPQEAGSAVAGGRRQEEPTSAANSTIRVDVSLLDKLMNLVGELVLARNQILQGAAHSGNSSGTAQRLNLITSELQEGVMRTRMQPIGVVWNKLPRVVRDLAAGMGKKIEIQMEGAETELDKTIIEAIKDPLTHIVRNSCDHGIESPEARLAKGKSAHGTILLRAFHEGGHVNIEISDDGAGIDPEKIKSKAVKQGLVRAEQAAQLTEWESLRLIFLPGFSTAEKVTSISGRGVGMDVVKTNIEKISGSVDLSNRPNAGSTIKIKIPLTLAIIPGLIVSVNSEAIGSSSSAVSGEEKRANRFVIPQANLLELVRLESDKDRSQLENINGAEVYRRRGKLLPLAHLSDVLGLPSIRRPEDVTNIVVVQAEDTAFGLVVDEVNDTQEIVVKALGKQLKALSCYLGATIMGDGKIALILDVTGIAKLANVLSQPVERSKQESRGSAEGLAARQMLLLFRSGRFPRLVLPLSLVARLEEFPTSRIEYAAGSPVLRYREALLPLIALSSLLDPGSASASLEGESLQVIVFREGEQYIGMVVDEILDIVDDAVTIRRPSVAFGLLGSGVVGGKVTDFVDLGALLAEVQGSASGPGKNATGRGSLLLVDGAKMARGVLRSYLEIHGYTVVEATGLDDAIEALERTSIDLIMTAVDLGEHRGSGIVDAVRVNPGAEAIRVIALTDEDTRNVDEELFDYCVDRTDRPGILRVIQSLTARGTHRHVAAEEMIVECSR